jgi:AhpD family alkylhydroperoxidase
MARLPLIEKGKGTADQNAFLEKTVPLNLFKMLANAPNLAHAAREVGRVLLFETALDPHLRELAILRVGHVIGCAYELAQHERIGRDLKMPEEKIAAAKLGPSSSAFGATEKSILEFTDQVLNTKKVTPETYKSVHDKLGDRQTLELATTIAYYTMIALLLEAFEVDLEGPSFKDGVKVT